MMTLFSRAVIFASEAHDGMSRRGSELPYLVHPMETAQLASLITSDQEVLSAAVLHDVMEDCGVDEKTLRERFGARVAELVVCETQLARGNPHETWCTRKRAAIQSLGECCREARLIALCDKLSNMRAIARDFARDGVHAFEKFHQSDAGKVAWYYRGCRDALRPDLETTALWSELDVLVEAVFRNVESKSDE